MIASLFIIRCMHVTIVSCYGLGRDSALMKVDKPGSYGSVVLRETALIAVQDTPTVRAQAYRMESGHVKILR